MRKKFITMFSAAAGVVVGREFDLFRRDEFIDLLLSGDVVVENYSLELYTPYVLDCCVAHLMLLDPEDEVFVFEEDQAVLLYLNLEEGGIY